MRRKGSLLYLCCIFGEVYSFLFLGTLIINTFLNDKWGILAKQCLLYDALLAKSSNFLFSRSVSDDNSSLGKCWPHGLALLKLESEVKSVSHLNDHALLGLESILMCLSWLKLL